MRGSSAGSMPSDGTKCGTNRLRVKPAAWP